MAWPLARELGKRLIPFVFVIGDNLLALPADLAGSATLVRPFGASVLQTTIEKLLVESGKAAAKSVM
jgi:hypothetical protein